MSFVVEALEEVGEFISDVVEEVGDAVEDVGRAVGDVVETVAKNPEILIIAVAAPQLLPTIGITGAAIAPVTAGLISASQGGDLEDIGKAALAAYVAPQVAGRVGGVVASAAEGSSLQNTLASTVGSAAGGATAAAITGGDIGESALLGAAGGAGGSIARDISTALEYGTTPFSEQTAGLISQDVGLNPITELAAATGAGAGRVAVGADAGREAEAIISGAIQREIAQFVNQATASSSAPEAEPTKQLIVSEIESNPAFRDQLQIANIASGGQPLTIEDQADVLAETYARQIFSDAAQMSSQDVALLPALAPVAGIAARSAAEAAVRAAPQLTQQIARFAANDPRFAAVMATNPYVQSLLAAAGLTVSVTMSGDTIVNPIQTPDQSPSETARLNRQAVEVQKTVPNPNRQHIQNLENTARRADYDQMIQDLQTKADQGYNVQRELIRAEQEVAKLPEIVPIEPLQLPEIEPGTAPQVAPQITPSTRPYTPTLPEIRPGTPARTRPIGLPVPRVEPVVRPDTRTQTEVEPVVRLDTRTQTETRTEPLPEPVPVPRPVTVREPSPTGPTGPTRPTVRPPVDTTPTEEGPRTEGPRTEGPRTEDRPEETITEQPVDIEDLITDEEIMRIITEITGGGEVTTATTGEFTPTLDLSTPVTRTPSSITREPRSISPRVTGEALSGLLKPKEPLFGGDEDAQRAVWNRRSLRLRKALGL